MVYSCTDKKCVWHVLLVKKNLYPTSLIKATSISWNWWNVLVKKYKQWKLGFGDIGRILIINIEKYINSDNNKTGLI